MHLKFSSRKLKLTLGAAVTALSLNTSGAAAVELPCSAVRLIVASNAGGNSDLIGRLVVEAVNRQPIEPKLQVVNIGGQATMRGSVEVASSKPDGCTLLINHQSLLFTYLTAQGEVTYTSFEPVARLTLDSSVLSAASETPYSDFAEFLAYAQANPDTILTGASLGGTSHVAVLMLEEAAGFRLKYVSYNGLQERITAMLGNHIQLSESDVGVASKYADEGAFKPLVVLSEERNPRLPEIPTARELGYDVTFGQAHGIFLPKETPPDIVEYYAGVFEAAMQDETLVQQLSTNGTQVAFLPGEDYEADLTVAFDQYTAILDELDMLDIRPQ